MKSKGPSWANRWSVKVLEMAVNAYEKALNKVISRAKEINKEIDECDHLVYGEKVVLRERIITATERALGKIKEYTE